MVFLYSIGIFGQSNGDYSGTWTFDKIISHPDDKLKTATMKMMVTQTPTEIKITGVSERVISYPIGKETNVEFEGSSGKIAVKLKAELTNKSRLNLNSIQTVKTNTGDVSIKIKETFELSSDGSFLRVNREIQNSKGLPISEAFVAKKQPDENSPNKPDNTVHNASDIMNQSPKGILNSKAKHLEIPRYPSGASVGRATGAVPVRVIFNEQGSVVFAQAIFGHPLLKSAAVEAAMKSTFEPVKLEEKIIKVSGIIVYDFRP